jgi:hypothetical protein
MLSRCCPIFYLVFEKARREKEGLHSCSHLRDTGKAALEGFRDVEDTKIFVFYPTTA